MSAWARSVYLLAILVAFSLVCAHTAVASVVFTVNSTDDGADVALGNGICSTTPTPPYVCTLRAAVMEANRTSGVGATIELPAGLYTLMIGAHDTDGEDNGDLNLSMPSGYTPGPTTITGAGAASTIIDANGIDRVLKVEPGRTAAISGITLRNGVADEGGGICNIGALTVSSSVLSGNKATYGGAIYSEVGTLTLSQSTLNGGNTAQYGGGIFNSGSMDVNESTVSGNSALYGGGVYNYVNTLHVTNSTISFNNAAIDGGGISSQGTASVYNSTIVGNQAAADNTSGGTGGGFFNTDLYVFNLRNSVVAGNYLSGSPIYDDCSGVVQTYGRNKYWVAGGGDFCTIVQHSPGSDTLLDSLGELGALQDNGGPTQTIALVPPSNMIDGGESTVGCIDQNGVPLTTDQRGHPRISGVRCDIGAFEYQEIIFANGFD